MRLILIYLLLLSGCIATQQNQPQEQMEETLHIITQRQYTAIQNMAKVNLRWSVDNKEYVLTYTEFGDINLDVRDQHSTQANRFYRIELNTKLSQKIWFVLSIGYDVYKGR